ncbi:MAG: FAD-dependent oxidoreductase [Candidatus Peribacteraceae bacterium]|nr:FAD-dependent oxidoreductase [Candidatus Peribacteraceae bacterium]
MSMPSGSDHAQTGSTVSVWMETSRPDCGPLKADIATDVCVVGAGIAGLTTAYLLSREKLNVVVLDDGPIGGGETERTTAHLVTALDDRYMDLEKVHGKEGSALAAQSHGNAIDRVERIVQDENIDCEFERVDGYLFLSKGEKEQLLQDELAAIHRAGLSDVQFVRQPKIDGLEIGPSLRFPRQAQFHPIKYLKGLAAAIEKAGGKIFTGTHASEVKGGKQSLVNTDKGHTVTAEHVVVATNAPINDSVRIYGQQAPYRTYVIAAAVPRGSIPQILLWDTGPYSKATRPVPYHYVRIQRGEKEDLLISGGEDHRTALSNDAGLRFERLERWTRSQFPMTGEIRYRWSGQVLEPADGLAMIGKNPGDEPNVLIATGDSGNGMTHGTIAGMLLTDMIVGRKNPWEALYDPSRFRLRGTKNLLRENVTTAKAMTTGWLSGSSIAAPEKLLPGSGAVIRRGLKKIALYRDPAGKFHECSAVCPHKGCIVRWNSLESSWDCPCHGSRFTPEGKVVNGPSIADLSPIQKK